MCSLQPFRFTFAFRNTEKINGVVRSGFRIQFTSIRGLSFVLYDCCGNEFGVGRTLIANAVQREFDGNLTFALVARALATIDALQYCVFGPISLLLNVLFMLFCFVAAILAFPFWLCFPRVKDFERFCLAVVLTTPLTLLLNIFGFVLVPLQIVLPELVVLMAFFRWDTGCKEDADLL